MSGLGGLSPEIIDAITRNLLISDYTRAELRNFLRGRVTTVTDEGEFTNSLKGLTKDIEVGTTEAPGVATGEILGALEGGGVVSIVGGVMIIRGAQIASELNELSTGTRDETISRNRLRDQLKQSRERGLIHGAMGTPSRNIQDLINQQAEAERFADRKSGREEKQPIRQDDPIIRKRDTSTGAEDQPILSDTRDTKKNTDKTGPTLPFIPKAVRADNINRGNRRPLQDINRFGRRPLRPRNPFQDNITSNITSTEQLEPPFPPQGGTATGPQIIAQENQTDVAKQEPRHPGGGEQQPYETKSESWLRPYYKQLGVDYFDKQFSKTPIDIENSEWSEFNYVAELDIKNKIEVDNHFNLRVRFSEPLFMPKYRQPLASPSEASIIAKRVPMKRVIQITQPFKNKFDGADMGENIVLYETYDRTGFDKNFSKLKIYNT